MDKQGCNSCGGDIESFGSTDVLFTEEARTTSRYILAGHRCLTPQSHLMLDRGNQNMFWSRLEISAMHVSSYLTCLWFLGVDDGNFTFNI